MSAAARLMLANARAAETLTRLKGEGGKETVYRQIVEVKREDRRAKAMPERSEEELDRERFAAARDIYLSGRPSPVEVARREAEEALRIAEGRPVDENTWWLRRHAERQPFWESLDRSLEEEGEGTPD